MLYRLWLALRAKLDGRPETNKFGEVGFRVWGSGFRIVPIQGKMLMFSGFTSHEMSPSITIEGFKL